MSNKLKLFLLAFVLMIASNLCFRVDHVLMVILGIFLKLLSFGLYGLWFMTLMGRVAEPPQDTRPRCPECHSRHYLIFPRGSKFGFAFPARFVKVLITDFRCQDCGCEWTLTEIDTRYDDA